MPTKKFPCIPFNQYGNASPGDDLLLFAAPARALATWAGIPRKAWHIRMLFQRPITPSRESELKQFWDTASAGGEEGFILGPTAIVVAIQGDPLIDDGMIDLNFSPLIDLEGNPLDALPVLVSKLYPQIKARLSEDQRLTLAEFEAEPFGLPFPDIEHDYVFEFALQMAQMRADAARFVAANEINQEELTEIVLSMESLCRPALVVDGQHRLWGAASSAKEIVLPVVGIPHCSWLDQIYQFVVINETAQKVETSLLTDIFGSSLTRSEQTTVRRKLSKSRVDVESRIAAVVASRDPESPFYNMISLRIAGTAPENYRPYLSERTVRLLIEGTSRFARGWRSDDEFYYQFVAPTFPVREEWDSWSSGRWRDYWIAFWATLRDFYNEQAEKLGAEPLWQPHVQTNLTKAVTLREMQSLFIAKCVEHIREIDTTASILKEMLGEEEANAKIAQLRVDRAIPGDLDAFRTFVHDFFLERGVPVKVFLASWKTSLDDAQGQLELWETLESAFERTRKGDRVVVRGGIFIARDPQETVTKDG